MRETIERNIYGRAYRIKQLSAARGLYRLTQERLSPLECVDGASVFVDGEWHELKDARSVNAYVQDVSGLFPPWKVLDLLASVVSECNFKGVQGRKQIKVPRRFVQDVEPVSVDEVHPILARLIASGKASMRELEEYYSVSDAVRIYDVLTADALTNAQAQEAAMEEAKRKSKQR